MPMFRKALKAIVGSPVAVQTKAQQNAGSIPLDLQKLDVYEPGLAGKVTAYIAGTGESAVLSTLA